MFVGTTYLLVLQKIDYISETIINAEMCKLSPPTNNQNLGKLIS